MGLHPLEYIKSLDFKHNLDGYFPGAKFLLLSINFKNKRSALISFDTMVELNDLAVILADCDNQIFTLCGKIYK